MLAVWPQTASAQKVFDRIKDATKVIKRQVEDVKEISSSGSSTFAAAKALTCTAKGTSCANVEASATFKPRRYSILAVALTSKGSSYGQVDLGQLVRDVFESAIVRKGYTAAPGADAKRIQQRIDQTAGGPESRQAQLKDFAESIDAVLMVEAGNPEVSRCQRTEGKRTIYGQELTVSMSVRWLNTDTPDIPWIATHRVVSCDTKYTNALNDALTELASELANAIPDRIPTPAR